MTTLAVTDLVRKVYSNGINRFHSGIVLDQDRHFRLNSNFLAQYQNRKPNFGFNGLGEFVFCRTYSRMKADDTKESFIDTLQRVVEGCYEIQRHHCNKTHIAWDYGKAQLSAQEMFQRMWSFKFLPPGRGLWMMGTEFMWTRGSSSLNNCGFVSTKDIVVDPAEPFCWLMDMSMLGVGVGFDTKGADQLMIKAPASYILTSHVIEDSREGWVESVRTLIQSYTSHIEIGRVTFDYSRIRLAGTPIKGFGGKASGPKILQDLHGMIRNLFDRRVGHYLSSVDIVDVMNFIGRCIVAGNVRRCLPKGTLVHLKRGLVPIEQVQVGDLVLTADGYHPVAENVQQGIQRVITIKTQMGHFRCTDRHRIAVMTGLSTYEWKRAYQLKPNDRMVFVDEVIPGVDTVLPGYSDASKRGLDLVIPGLTAEVAWFLGALHGDGYVYPGRAYKGRRYHGASVSVPINQDEYHDGITAKVNAGFAAFGFYHPGEQPSDDNCRKVRVISRRLAHYLHQNFKQARTPLGVPECVRLGKPEIRAAYLAGLLDTDGSVKTRPTTLVCSVYYDFIRQVQAVYASLGIPTKLRLNREANNTNQAKWLLSLVGEFAIERFRRSVQPHAVKQLRTTTYPSHHDFGYPAEWVTREEVPYKHSWTPQSDQMTHQRALLCGAKVANLIPVAVEELVDEGIEVETYDLSVPDRCEFVAHGLLVHNTAEISFGDADDAAYCRMKNPKATLIATDAPLFDQITQGIYSRFKNSGGEVSPFATLADFADSGIPEERLIPAIRTWNAMNSHRWASNNSIFAKVGMDYTEVGHNIGINGEPGLAWLDNMRHYGRMADGRQEGIDGRVMGGNPCFSGNMRLLTAAGYVSLEDLWYSGGAQEYRGLTADPCSQYGSQQVINRNGLVPATKIYRTSDNTPLYRVTFSDNSSIEATANHQFIVLERTEKRCGGRKKRTAYTETRKQLHELRPGQLIPLNQTVHFGTFHDPAYAELAGWCIGDGSLSSQLDNQTRAICTCYESDVQDVLPRLSALMLETYQRHTKSSNQSPVYAGWKREQEFFSHDQESIGSCVLGRLLNEDGVRSGDKHRIPTRLWNGTRETIAAFLRGLASADGYVHVTDNGTIGVRISQSNKQLLLDCRLLLNQFGIASTVQLRGAATKQLMNDGKGGKKLYNKKAKFELIMSGRKQTQRFLDYIGFIQEWKMAEGRAWLTTHHGSNNSDTGRYIKIKTIEAIGSGPTYCLTEPGDNQVVIEGYQVGQCLEQSLESYELCCLVETFPAHHDSAADYLRTLKFAYLYAKTVTLMPTHNPRTNQVAMRNRRIGLSQSGIVQAFSKFGRRRVLEDFCDAGYREVCRWDKIYSEWLCITESIKKTSVKPSGTVSLVAGVTPGIHHPEAQHYWRHVRVAKDSILVKIFSEAGYAVESAVSDPERTVVIRFGVSDESVRPVGEVSIWEQMANVVDYQRYWADNQVSCTVKFKPHERDEIPRVLAAYEDQLKGISFLPHEDHGYPQAPYVPCTKQEVEDYNSRLQQPDFGPYLNEAVGSVFCDNDSCTV